MALISPEIAPPAFAADLLRLHRALTTVELWHAVRVLVENGFPHALVALELEGAGHARARVYRHMLPAPARRAAGGEHPLDDWLELHPEAAVIRLSDVMSLRELRTTAFFREVMAPQGWDKLLVVSVCAGRLRQAALHLCRRSDESDFSVRDVRLASALQPHFAAAVQRVMAHEHAVHLGEQLAGAMEDAPLGLLLLDRELRPLWFNREGANACAVWNHGERKGVALRAKRAFRVPNAIVEACAKALTAAPPGKGGTVGRTLLVSDTTGTVHAQITLRGASLHAAAVPAFHVQLDYRRPRGDRHRSLSPGTVALLGRLSPREREVAMHVREGLRTPEIAARLQRSPLTVKTQLAAIFRKLELNSRARVAALLNR